MALCAGEGAGAGSAARTAIFRGCYVAVVLELVVDVELGRRNEREEKDRRKGGNIPDCAEVR